MKTKATKETMETFIEIFDYHTKMFLNALDGISDEDAQNRLGTKANHIAWIAGSLVYQRQYIANTVGIDVKQTSEKLFENNKGIQDNVTYPSLQEFKDDWNKISPLLKDALTKMSEEELNGPDPYKMPGGNFTFFDTAVVFSIDRESYCLGQIGLYRRLLGYEAMKYPE
jgi:hypothetical protein